MLVSNVALPLHGGRGDRPHLSLSFPCTVAHALHAGCIVETTSAVMPFPSFVCLPIPSAREDRRPLFQKGGTSVPSLRVLNFRYPPCGWGGAIQIPSLRDQKDVRDRTPSARVDALGALLTDPKRTRERHGDRRISYRCVKKVWEDARGPKRKDGGVADRSTPKKTNPMGS